MIDRIIIKIYKDVIYNTSFIISTMTVILLSIVIFLPTLFLKLMSEDTFDCTGYEDDSFHPIYDGIDCRQYWHCIYVGTNYMRAVKRVCPAGASFDILSKECELSSIVRTQSLFFELESSMNLYKGRLCTYKIDK